MFDSMHVYTGSVPDYVKKELLQQIKEYLEKT